MVGGGCVSRVQRRARLAVWGEGDAPWCPAPTKVPARSVRAETSSFSVLFGLVFGKRGFRFWLTECSSHRGGVIERVPTFFFDARNGDVTVRPRHSAQSLSAFQDERHGDDAPRDARREHPAPFPVRVFPGTRARPETRGGGARHDIARFLIVTRPRPDASRPTTRRTRESDPFPSLPIPSTASNAAAPPGRGRRTRTSRENTEDRAQDGASPADGAIHFFVSCARNLSSTHRATDPATIPPVSRRASRRFAIDHPRVHCLQPQRPGENDDDDDEVRARPRVPIQPPTHPDVFSTHQTSPTPGAFFFTRDANAR
jgi:hypothetical protein